VAHRPKATRDKEKARTPLPVAAAPVPPPSGPPAWRRHAVPLLILWGLALVAYSNSFRAGLIYDNHLVVAQDSRVRQVTEENVRLILTKDYWYKNSVSALYRPLATLSYLFNYAVLGNHDAPAGYHAVNLALHAANIALVYLLGWLLLAEFWPAFAMAAIWAVHPVLTESVTNVVGRADELAAFGVLAGLLCYARGVTAAGRRAMLWQVGVLAASSIAIFSKESGIAIVAAVFFYDIAFCRGKPWRPRIIGLVAAALPIVVFLAARNQVLKDVPLTVVAFTDNPLVGADFWTARLTAVKVLGQYLWLLFWPARLSCDYTFNQIPLFSWSFGRWEDWQAIVSLAVYAAAAVLAVFSYRRARPVFFFIAFFFAAMAPTANLLLLIGTIMAERVLYLPSVGFAGCIAWAGWQAYQRLRPRWPALRIAFPAALATVCLVLCGRTFARNFDWYSDQTLWASAVKVSPASYRSHDHMANALAAPPRKDFDAAIHEADAAIAILQPLPDYQKVAVAYAKAGLCYRLKGESMATGGAEWYRKGLDVLLEGKRVDEAWDAEFQRQNRLAGKIAGPSHVLQVYVELGRTYRDLGQYRNALDTLTAHTMADPQSVLFDEISKTYRAMGDPAQAVVSLFEGLAMGATDQVLLAAEVVDLYRQTAQGSCALTGSGDSSAVNFNCPLVHDELCLAQRNVAIRYHQMHRDPDALTIATGAVRSLGCPVEMFR
jgi:tetratricopeptide (TPR) repeat protein